ncbi:MAG: nucleotidyltransferase domain-containing protein [Candidatus Methylomirabilia bacterium]
MTRKGLRDLKLDVGLRAALEAARDRLKARFEVDRIVLFGSLAWGRPDDESDVDILVVLKDRLDVQTEDQISQVIFEINLEYDANLSELIIDRQTWDHGMVSAMPIHEEIEKRGIRL